MPTTLGYRLEPDWNGYPPHISRDDLELWKRYRSSARKEAIAFYFDVGVGGQTEVPEGTEPELARMWLHHTQKRIDVLIQTILSWVICELRHNATAAAAGRLLQYKNLWGKEPIDEMSVTLRLITDRFDPDLQSLLNEINIEYVIL